MSRRDAFCAAVSTPSDALAATTAAQFIRCIGQQIATPRNAAQSTVHTSESRSTTRRKLPNRRPSQLWSSPLIGTERVAVPDPQLSAAGLRTGH